VCAYFVYSSYLGIRDHELQVHHELWTIVTWAVWLLLLAGIIPETRCWRERVLFTLVLTNCAVGLTVCLWNSIPFGIIHEARELSLALWLLACVAGFMTLLGSGKADATNANA
jgi:hypothetical protein